MTPRVLVGEAHFLASVLGYQMLLTIPRRLPWALGLGEYIHSSLL
jgi:hypothetical protein